MSDDGAVAGSRRNEGGRETDAVSLLDSPIDCVRAAPLTGTARVIEYGSVLGALLFGAYHHYVLISPDNIGHLPSGSPESHAAFIASAAVLTLLELASALSGAFCLGTHAAQSRAHD